MPSRDCSLAWLLFKHIVGVYSSLGYWSTIHFVIKKQFLLLIVLYWLWQVCQSGIQSYWVLNVPKRPTEEPFQGLMQKLLVEDNGSWKAELTVW